MYAAEKSIVNEQFVARDDTYNLRVGGRGGFGYINRVGIGGFSNRKHTEESKKLIGAKTAMRRHAPDTIEKLKKNHWSKTNPEAFRNHVLCASQMPRRKKAI